MKHILLALISSVLLTSTLFATQLITDKTKLQALTKENKVLQNPVLSIKGAIDKPGSYVLKIEARSPRGSQLLSAVLDKKTGELYIGTAYNKEGQLMAYPKDAQAIKEGVAFSYGDKGKDIYLVTDPECPYCSRFEKAAAGKLGDYKVHVILMPLSFHKKAPAMIEWIMQGKDDAQRKERFEKLMLEGSTDYKTLIKDAKKPFIYSDAVGAHMKKVQTSTMELDVQGTPAIYDEHFMPVSQEQLFTHIKKKEDGGK